MNTKQGNQTSIARPPAVIHFASLALIVATIRAAATRVGERSPDHDCVTGSPPVWALELTSRTIPLSAGGESPTLPPRNVKRIAVIGPPGAGKSRLAGQLGAKLGLRILHLDRLYWKPGWVRTPHDEWVAAQRRELAGESWIVDAQYDDMLPDWIDAADTIVFLDASPLRCFWRVTRRRLHPQPAPGVPVGSQPGPVHRALGKFVRNQWEYRRKVRPELVADIARGRDGQRVVVLRSDTDLRRFLSGA